jgi:hypothetical protein
MAAIGFGFRQGTQLFTPRCGVAAFTSCRKLNPAIPRRQSNSCPWFMELKTLAAQRMAHEKPGQTLQATGLVHEAYLRLVDVKKAQRFNSRGHFFAAAAILPRCWARRSI